MSVWLIVFGVWLLMLLVVLALRRLAGRYANPQGGNDAEDSTGGGYAPHAAWRELDIQTSRHGAGHPLQ